MLSRSLLALALAAAAFSSAPVEAGEWSLDFSSSSVSANIGRRGHRVSTRRYAPRKVWVAGCYVNENRRTWVAGAQRRVYVQPVYRTRYDSCGRSSRVLISDGYYEVVRDRGYYENRRVRVWRAGFWRVTRRSHY